MKRNGYSSSAFDKRFFVRTVLVWTGIIVLGRVTNSLVYLVAYPAVMFMSAKRDARGAAALTFLLLMMSFAQCMNFTIAPKTVVYAYAQRFLILSLGAMMTIGILSRGLSPLLRPMGGIFVYIAAMILPSLMGWSPVVSVLKMILFSLSMMAILGMASDIASQRAVDVRRVRSAVVAYGCIALVGSVLLTPFPSICQMGISEIQMSRDEILTKLETISLFKGMTQHSQCMGPVAVLATILFCGDYVFGVRRNNWMYNIIIACGLFCVWKSSSRTALASLLFGVMACLSFVFMGRMREMKSRWRANVKNVAVVISLVSVLGVMLVPQIRERVVKFVVKYNNEGLSASQITLDDITASRRGALERPLANWRKSPIFGNGFQVSEEMASVHVDDVTRILSAPVEKGTWVVAILEEGGLIGFLCFVIWAAFFLLSLKRHRAYIGFAMFLALLMLNLGEFTIFAMTSVGIHQWALVLVGCALDAQRQMADRRLGAGAFPA